MSQDDECVAGSCRHWEASTTDGGDTVHLTPLNDDIAHTKTDDCVCGPVAQVVLRPDRADAWIHTHHSLDGREATE